MEVLVGSEGKLLCLVFLSALLLGPPPALGQRGTIRRTTKQQILASIPAHSDPQSSRPLLTSPSGRYAMHFVRRGTAPGAGGYGADFCYVQVRGADSGTSVWESECAPMSNENTCSLVFSDQGLEVFDGSRSAWGTGVDADNPLETLELVDEGDMRIRDQTGELAWRASDDPRANQECGSPGAPGMGGALPPFAAPIDTGSAQSFGQPSSSDASEQQQFPVGFQQQPLGYQQQHHDGFGQPLVDNTPFYSGSSVPATSFFHLVLAILVWSAECRLLF